MDFSTKINIPNVKRKYGYTDRFMLIGSCFAENIGKQLACSKFSIDINPFGIQYNPSSIGRALRLLLDGRPFAATDLFCEKGIYYSFMHHGSFSADTENGCLELINSRFEKAAEGIRTASVLVVTLGTAWVYKLKSTGEIVSNCHKLPEKMFVRERLSVDEIVEDWSLLLNDLFSVNPGMNVLFTVSPIRHWKDGAHENQLSKATLLLAVDELKRKFVGRTDYFPSYEIMMDELRDYRFYADDMIHPSPLAVNYIWEKFCENYITPQSKEVMKEIEEIRKAVAHRPFRQESEAYRQFMFQTLLKIDGIREKFPYFDFTEEKMFVESKLK